MVSRVDGHGGDEVILADIRAAQDGDAGAYARIVKSWGGRLLRFCRNNLPATIDAEDVVQDVLLTAWQKLPGLDDRSRFRAWMYTIARNRCREVIPDRREARYRSGVSGGGCGKDRFQAGPSEGSCQRRSNDGAAKECCWVTGYPEKYLGNGPDRRSRICRDRRY